MKWALAILAILIAIGAVAYKLTFSTYSYRYRLTIAVKVDGQVHTGSSVIQVTWECGPRVADTGGCGSTLGGQATVVDLGARGLLAATLRTGEHVLPVPEGAVDATFLCAKAFGNGSSLKELPALVRLTGRRDLSPDNFPRLVWFPDPDNPKSAMKVTPATIPTVVGGDARIESAFVEITRDQAVVDIARKLRWYPALAKDQKENPPLVMPTQFYLYYRMFVGEDS
jgi:hypothetical protein